MVTDGYFYVPLQNPKYLFQFHRDVVRAFLSNVSVDIRAVLQAYTLAVPASNFDSISALVTVTFCKG